MAATRFWLRVALSVLLAGCVPETSAPSATDGPAAIVITETVRSEIGTALSARAQALASRDLKAFQATIDMTRPTLRRCEQELFERTARAGGGSGIAPAVGKLEPYGRGYVRAYIDNNSSGYQRTYFRKEGPTWLWTEPTDDELGGERTTTIDGLEMSYWGIDDDIVHGFARAGLETRAFLLKVARVEPKTPFALRMFPTRGAAGLTASCQTAGTAHTAASGDRYLRLYQYTVGRDFAGPSDFTKSVITHEGLHWLQEQTVAGIIARLDWWLVEGWPDYVAGSRAQSHKVEAVCRASVPTFKQLVDGPDADPHVLPERVGEFYAFANTMVEYLYATYSDHAYWALMEEFRASVDPQVTYPRALGVSANDLYRGWLAYSRTKYC